MGWKLVKLCVGLVYTGWVIAAPRHRFVCEWWFNNLAAWNHATGLPRRWIKSSTFMVHRRVAQPDQRCRNATYVEQCFASGWLMNWGVSNHQLSSFGNSLRFFLFPIFQFIWILIPLRSNFQPFRNSDMDTDLDSFFTFIRILTVIS